MKDLKHLKQRIWNSDFNRTNYEICLDIIYLKRDLIYWNLCTNDKASGKAKILSDSSNTAEVLRRITPEFQRNNDKWSQDMQIKFVENIVLGSTSIIMLGSLTGEKSECVLLDGLQRITAIFAFMNNEFKIFNEYEYNEEFERICTFIHNLKLRIYNFKTEQEMVNFYININENITHSKEDIQKAKDYLNLI